ncbi:MAG TPA: lytic transglycosylase domain-containing protein [Stellaceae bacterium]|nr:lytic transglycosylase domain-containing protein [Stellaceae bacterium]
MIPGLSAVAAAAPHSSAQPQPRELVCRFIDNAAAANRLPAAFLARVLWQESRFDSDATSRAGAEGVAQFMPQTAAERGLADPRDPGSAIAHAARLLADLAARFGNLGLAAAAYNAGSGRVARWLDAQSDLPAETRLYVAAVTGRPVEDWGRRSVAPPGMSIDSGSCLAAIADATRMPSLRIARTVWQVRLDDTLAGAVRLLSALPLDRPEASPNSLHAARGLCDSVRSLGARCAVYQP